MKLNRIFHLHEKSQAKPHYDIFHPNKRSKKFHTVDLKIKDSYVQQCTGIQSVC